MNHHARMTALQPATPLPKIAVSWDDARERVTLFTLGNRPHDYPLATSKDSGKGELYERIAHAANAYPRLVEALRECQKTLDACRYSERPLADRTLALLRELGELP